MRTKNKEEQPPPGAENIVPLPVEQMKVYPMATGMTEEDVDARIQKRYPDPVRRVRAPDQGF
jgi:hypothetical protein